MIRNIDDTLCGLPISDLTLNQINKVNTKKLVRCLGVDLRVENILATRMILDTKAEEILEYRELNNEWSYYPTLRQAYNNLLVLTNLFENKLSDYYSYYRSNYIFWHALNDTHKLLEVQAFLQGKNSVVSNENVDYEWLNTFDLKLSHQVIIHVVSTEPSYSKLGTLNIITKASQDMLREIEPNIQRLNKDYQLKLLSNPNTPEDWLDKLLRIYAKKVKYSVPEINCLLSSATLKKLPPITRLEVMERLVYKSDGERLNRILPDIHNSEDFRALLFGSIIRHSDRVINLIKTYNNKISVKEIETI